MMTTFTFSSIYTLTLLATTTWLSATIANASPVYPHQQVARRQPIAARAVSCFPLEFKDASRLPAWGKVSQYLDDTFGKGYDAILLNDAEYPEVTADACMDVSTVPVSFADPPRCSTTKNEISGNVDGTNQTITFNEKIGTEQKASWTVTKESTIGGSVEFSLDFEIPVIGGGGGVKTTVSGEFKNTRSESFEATSSTLQEKTFQFVNRDGQTCKFELESESCVATARGRAPVVAKGRIFVRYPNRRPKLAAPDGEKHFHWFVALDEVLTEAERTSFIEFQGPVSIVNTAGYETGCSDSNSPPPVCSSPPTYTVRSKATGVPVTAVPPSVTSAIPV